MNLSEIRPDHAIVYCWRWENDNTYVKIGKSRVNAFHISVAHPLPRYSPYDMKLLGIEVFNTDKEAIQRESELLDRFDRVGNREWVVFDDNVKMWLETCIEPPSLDFFASHNKERERKRQREYRQENKERMQEYEREYRQKPERKEYNRKYNKEYKRKPEEKQRRKEYQQNYKQRPEVKQRARENQREYRKDPKNKQRAKEYQQEYYKKPENKQRRREYENQPERKEYQREYNRKRYAKRRKKRPVSPDTLDLF